MKHPNEAPIPAVQQIGSEGAGRLEGQTALITGASRGIGLRLASALSARGARVVGTARHADPLEDALAAVGADSGVETLALTGDVTDPAQVAAVVAQTEHTFGPIDLLINNAGLVDAAEVGIWEADSDQWWEVVTSHVRGAQLTIAAVVPGMIERGTGRVINLASGMGTRAIPEYSAYSVAKAAQMRLTEALDLALEDTGVRAFNIAPGLVRTDMTTSMPKWDNHTAWTPPEKVVELVCAVATGTLDNWHGRFLRAGIDDPTRIATRQPTGAARQLRLQPWGADDPMN